MGSSKYVRALAAAACFLASAWSSRHRNNLGLTRFYEPTYGWSITTNVANIINPTMTNEFQFLYTVNGIPGDPPVAGSPNCRSVSDINIPRLYRDANTSSVIANFNFGGVSFGAPTLNGSQMTGLAGTPYNNPWGIS